MIHAEARMALADLLRTYLEPTDEGLDEYCAAVFEAQRVLIQTREETREIMALRDLFELGREQPKRVGFEERRKRTRAAVETARKALEGN